MIRESSCHGLIQQTYLEELLDNFVVDLVFLATLVVLELLQVGGKVFAVPRVLLNFVNFDPLHRVRLQHPVDQVSHIARDVVGEEEPAFTDFLKEDGQLVVVKGQAAAHHGVQNYAAGPDVHLLAPIALATDDFRCSVVRRPAGSA